MYINTSEQGRPERAVPLGASRGPLTAPQFPVSCQDAAATVKAFCPGPSDDPADSMVVCVCGCLCVCDCLQQQTGGHLLRKATGYPHVPPCPFCVCQATGHLFSLSPPCLGLNTEEDRGQYLRAQMSLLPGGSIVSGWGAGASRTGASVGEHQGPWDRVGRLNADRWPLGAHA